MPESTLELATGFVEFAEKSTIHVLHVDDEESFLKVAKECLQMQGDFEVDNALSVKEAETMMKKKEYDVIVCDYQMPGKDGLQFLEELRKSGNSIPFILFTGRGREEVAIKALNLGADGYIGKNGKPEIVYAELAYNICKAAERRKAEIRLKLSEAKYRTFFETAYDCLLLMDLKGNIIDVNNVVLEYGFTKEELVGRNVTEYVSPKDKPRIIEEISLKAKGKSFEGTIEVNTPKGNVLAAYRCKPLIIEDRVIGIQAVLKDITKRKETYQNIYEILNLVLTGILIVDEKTHEIVYANPHALEIIGASKEKVIGKVCHHFVCPAEKGKCPISDLGQTIDNSERVLLRISGESIPILKTATRVVFRGNNYIVESFIDITHLKKQEEKLRDSEEKYRRLFDEVLDAIFIADAETGIIVDCNRAAAELVCRDKSELIGKHQSILHPPERIKDGFSITFKQHVTGKEEILEDQVITKNGEIKEVAIKAAVFEFKGKKLIQGIFRDITKQKKAEKALRESEEAYRALLNGMNDTAWVIGFDGKFIDVNDAAVKVLGYSREELPKMGPPDIDASLTEEQIKELIRNMPKDKIQVFETTHKTKDGRVIPVEISSSLVTYKGKTAILSIARDITERKKAEEKMKRLMEQLKMVNEKLGVVGKWTRHDARNKLSVIKSNIYLAKKKLPSDHAALKYLDEIELACDQITRIFNFASQYEMLGVEERVYVDVGRSFEEAVALTSNLNSVKLLNNCQGLIVLADSQLRQLFYNLIDNSLRHGEKVSQIRIYYAEEADRLKLVYEDNGMGISSEARSNLFKEGYGKGTGYGLYLAAKLCEMYGWKIQETGEYGKGAQFTIIIPKTNEKGGQLYKIQS
jgi:PAS domain S-box-containing protein